MMKRYLPYALKVRWQLLKRAFRDLKKGRYFAYAKAKSKTKAFPYCFELKQELKPNEAKKQNLIQAIKAIEKLEIGSSELFSFWRAVGAPTERRGYVASRSLVAGKITSSVGGGLCQLGGLIYHLSLFTPLAVLERHCHSLDIYTEETRFAPLGSDATVAYGYKDLIICNTLDSPIRFSFDLEEEYITIKLHHCEPFTPRQVRFEREELEAKRIQIKTFIDDILETTSTYQKL